MRWITEDARLTCNHAGRVAPATRQDFVRIAGSRVLVRDDTEKRGIANCTNHLEAVGVKACTATLDVQQGYSAFVRVADQPVCLDTLWGFTDGTPPRIARYEVADPGQQFVAASA